MTIEFDNHEPKDIIRYVEPVVDVVEADLNTHGYGDYFWTGEILDWYPGHDGSYQLERKTATDLAGGADAIEDQIRREIKAHPESYFRLLVEGNLEPAPGGGVMAYQKASGRDVMISRKYGGNQQGLFKKVVGQVAGWSEFVEIVYSASYASTSMILVELYRRDNRAADERTTFRRFFKPMPAYTPNQQVQRLVGAALNDTGIGIEIGQRIIEQYGTVWAFIHADPKAAAGRIKGISENTVKVFMRKLGRLDV